MRKISLLVLVLVGWGVLANAAEEYLTAEERNKRVMEEMVKQHQQMLQMQQEDYKPSTVDYSKYNTVHDYKNVFAELQSDKLDTFYQEKGRAIQLQEIEKNRQFLKSAEFDYVVLPIQEVGFLGQDVIARLLSAEILAASLENWTGKKVISPETVMRSFGWKKKLFNEYVLFDLVKEQSPKVVHLYLKKLLSFPLGASPTKDEYDLAVVVSDTQGHINKQKIFRIENISALETLEVKVGILKDNIIEHITGISRSSITPQQVITPCTIESQSLKDSYDELLREASPLTNAAHLQLLAMLTPVSFHTERVSLFIRSLLALEKCPENSTDKKLLKARALHYLHRRPQAVELIAQGNSPELTALGSYLNGNYFKLKNAVKNIESPVLYTISYLELFDLSSKYGKKNPKLDTSKVSGGWKWMIARQCDSYSEWYSESLRELWGAMLEIYPKISSMEQKVAESFTPVDTNDDDPAIIIIERMLWTLGQFNINDNAYGVKITDGDIKRFYCNLLVNHLESRLNKISNLQGRYNDGVEFAEKSASVLTGYPRFSKLHTEGLVKLAIQKTHQKQYLLKKAYNVACTVADNYYPYEDLYIQTQSLVNQIKRLGYTGDNSCFSSGSFSQFPSSEDSHEYSATSFQNLIADLRKKRITEEHFKNTLKIRYDGNPEKQKSIAENLWKEGKKEEAIASLRSSITEDEIGWTLYEMLGDYLLRQGEFEEAEKLMTSYPYFLEIPSNYRVNTANLAYTIGGKFLNIGRFEEASRFFSLCVSVGTGAGSEMLSQFYLHSFFENYEKAVEMGYRAYLRYNSNAGFSRYFMMQTMLGQQEADRALLKTIIKRANGNVHPQLWLAARVDQRVLDGPDLSFANETKMVTKVGSVNNLQNNIDKSLFYNVIIDRALMKGKVISFTQKGRKLKKLWTERGLAEAFPNLAKQIEQNWSELPEEQQTFQRYNSLYNGLVALETEQFEEAVEQFIFHDMVGFTPELLGNEEISTYMFPFVIEAISRSKYGSSKTLEKIFEIRKKALGERLELSSDYLAEAITTAIQGNLDKSLKLYMQSNRCGDGNSYSFVHFGERLHNLTGDSKFIDVALERAQREQVISPWLGWTYAFEVAYTTDYSRRIQSASKALYLDRRSHWLSRAPDLMQEGEKIIPFKENPEILEKKINGEAERQI